MMELEREEILRRKQLALIGRMLTGKTRKIQDHLAKLQVSAGSLANLLRQSNQGTGEDSKKTVDLLSTIERHLNFLSQKTKYLHRFGQRMEAPLSSFDPREVIEETVLFSTRLAHLCRVSLRLEMDETLPGLYNDPVCMHFLVSILINCMLERVSRGSKVIVSAGPVEKGLLVRVEGDRTPENMAPSALEAGDRYWCIGQKMAANLGGRLQPASLGHHTKQISLLLPLGTGFNQSRTERVWTGWKI